jgi:hypothetical protein
MVGKVHDFLADSVFDASQRSRHRSASGTPRSFAPNVLPGEDVIPNPPADDVPDGEEDDFEVLREVGQYVGESLV